MGDDEDGRLRKAPEEAPVQERPVRKPRRAPRKQKPAHDLRAIIERMAMKR